MRLCLLLLAFLLTHPLIAQESSGQAERASQSPTVEREEREFNFYPGGKVEVTLAVPGSLKIVGWKRGSVRVEAEKILYYETEEAAKAFLKKSPVRIRHSDTVTAIRAAGNPEPPGMLEVNLTVYVPGEKTDVNVKMDRGEFSIDSVNGWVEITLQEGSLEAKAMSGYFSGSVLKGDVLVEMSGIRWNGLELAAVTRQGSATLVLPETYSAALQLETRDGKVTVDYPPRIVEGEEVPPEIVIRKKSQSLKASVGDGGAPIRLVTYSGDVLLSKKTQ